MRSNRTAKLIASLLMAVFLVLSITSGVTAALELDMNRLGTLTVEGLSTTAKEPVTGLDVSIYKVGEISDGMAPYVKATGFEGVTADLTDISTTEKQNAASDIVMAYINEKGIGALSSERTSVNGKARFENLSLGLYFVTVTAGEKVEPRELPKPFFVAVPMMNKTGSGYIYDVTASPKINPEPVTELISVKVTKVWDDNKNEAEKRPGSIIAELYGDGKLYASATLNEGCKWTHTFTSLDEKVKWTVKEKVIPNGYKCSVDYDGRNVTITNKYTTEKLPQTGQDYTTVIVLASAGVVLVIGGALFWAAGAVRNRKKTEDK